jgi:hypothetical protein
MTESRQLLSRKRLRGSWTSRRLQVSRNRTRPDGPCRARSPERHSTSSHVQRTGDLGLSGKPGVSRERDGLDEPVTTNSLLSHIKTAQHCLRGFRRCALRSARLVVLRVSGGTTGSLQLLPTAPLRLWPEAGRSIAAVRECATAARLRAGPARWRHRPGGTFVTPTSEAD